MSYTEDTFIQAAGDRDTAQPETRKPYAKPAIVHELKLETRAGSPLGIPDPMDPFGLDPK